MGVESTAAVSFVKRSIQLLRSERLVLSRSQAWVCPRCFNRSNSDRAYSTTFGRRAQTQDPIRREVNTRWDTNIRFTLTSAWRARYSKGRTQYSNDNGELQNLPSKQEQRESQLSKRFAHLMDTVQSNVFIAGQRLNDLTGYSGIEALKRDIETQERLLSSSRSNLQQARDDYAAAIANRSSSQREVNTLLHRKDSWSPGDLERFTALYRSDHANEQNEGAARERLTRAEKETEEVATRLNATILARYHEEQIWSDKIRRMSTWGTWGLMGVNVLLFLVFQIAVEPWRRKRLVSGFEEKVAAALEREELAAKSSPTSEPPELDVLLEAPVATTDTLVVEGVEMRSTVAEDSHEFGSLQEFKSWVYDLFSDRPVVRRRLDMTATALEGIAVGAALATLVVTVLVHPR